MPMTPESSSTSSTWSTSANDPDDSRAIMTVVKISSLNVAYWFDVDGNAEATLENQDLSILQTT